MRAAVVPCVLATLSSVVIAQGSTISPFTAEDALDVASYSIGDLSADGRWLAATSTTRRAGLGVDYRRDGDPTYIRPAAQRVWVIDTHSGAARAVFPDARNVRALRWSPDGKRLAMLLLDGESFRPVIYDVASAKLSAVKVPAGTYVAENSELQWMPDGQHVAFALRTPAWKRAAQDSFALYTRGPVFVQSSTDPFLAWDWLRQSASMRRVVSVDVRSGTVTELLPEGMLSSWEVTEDGRDVTFNQDVTKKTDYDVIFGRENVLRARQGTAEARTVLSTLKGLRLVWAEDGRHFAYGKEGRVYVGTIDDTATRQVAGLPADAKREPGDTSAATRERRERERFAPVAYSPANDALVVSNRDGLWLLELPSGTRSQIIATSDSSPASPRASIAAWSRDGKHIYLTVASRTEWKRGIARYDRDARQLRDLVMDDRAYSGLRLSRDGSTVVLNVAPANHPAELYAADAELKTLRRLTNANPQLTSKGLARTELLTYLDADGHRKFAVVYYPADYRAGTPYPTVFNVYEEFFDPGFDATANVLASHGYVVVKPSVDFDVGYPGEAWLKGVTAAANKLIEMGVADSTRLGVHGTSYGGYATNLLITQTDRFRAAINISGKVDIISFYTDSPRLGVRNVHAAEKSQDRIGATLWEQPQKYVQHSAVMFADRIRTPLMLITGAQDSNVPADNTREMYYALRRLGKEVVWVNYMNGGHGGGNATADDFLDMHRRMLAWYDAKLKRPAAASKADQH